MVAVKNVVREEDVNSFISGALVFAVLMVYQIAIKSKLSISVTRYTWTTLGTLLDAPLDGGYDSRDRKFSSVPKPARHEKNQLAS